MRRLCQAAGIPARQNARCEQEERLMKSRFATGMAITLFTAALSMAADGTWTGWISDSKCGVKGANDKAGECTTKCVKGGEKYVFVNDADKKV
jgi:hypothetical protein